MLPTTPPDAFGSPLLSHPIPSVPVPAIGGSGQRGCCIRVRET